jgi:hypothetical protein
MRTDMTRVMVAFRNFVNAPNKEKMRLCEVYFRLPHCKETMIFFRAKRTHWPRSSPDWPTDWTKHTGNERNPNRVLQQTSLIERTAPCRQSRSLCNKCTSQYRTQDRSVLVPLVSPHTRTNTKLQHYKRNYVMTLCSCLL